jgi:hypothetical protein
MHTTHAPTLAPGDVFGGNRESALQEDKGSSNVFILVRDGLACSNVLDAACQCSPLPAHQCIVVCMHACMHVRRHSMERAVGTMQHDPHSAHVTRSVLKMPRRRTHDDTTSHLDRLATLDKTASRGSAHDSKRGSARRVCSISIARRRENRYAVAEREQDSNEWQVRHMEFRCCSTQGPGAETQRTSSIMTSTFLPQQISLPILHSLPCSSFACPLSCLLYIILCVIRSAI